jgi:hypothetical protein
MLIDKNNMKTIRAEQEAEHLEAKRKLKSKLKRLRAERLEQEAQQREAIRKLKRLRVEQMREQRASGMTFDEIATNFDVTKERVRQILAEFPDLKAECMKAREAQKWAEVLDHADEIDKSFKRNRNKQKVIQEFPSISYILINRYLDGRFPLHPTGKNYSGRWSKEEMVGFLQEAAGVRHSLSGKEYKIWSERTQSEGRNVPIGLAIIRRFGKWNNAIEAAGLEPRTRSNDYVGWTDDDVHRVARLFISCQIEQGKQCSITNFDKWLLEQPVGSVPSQGLFRYRIPDWVEYVDVALAEIQTTDRIIKQE